MNTQIKINEEGAPVLFEDNIGVDSHCKAYGEEDYISKAAVLLFRKYGWEVRSYLKLIDQNIVDFITKQYFTINGEDASEYVHYLPTDLASSGIENINGAMARLDGFRTYKELVKAGFKESFAALTAYNYHLILVNPDSREILKILKEVDEYHRK